MNLIKEYNRKVENDTVIRDNNDFILYQNYPNPFNPSTTISYSLSSPSNVRIELFNSLGELVRLLFRGFQSEGSHSIYLSFTNSLLSSGVYFYRLEARPVGSQGITFLQVRKMILLK